jgi:hypothetical protein
MAFGRLHSSNAVSRCSLFAGIHATVVWALGSLPVALHSQFCGVKSSGQDKFGFAVHGLFCFSETANKIITKEYYGFLLECYIVHLINNVGILYIYAIPLVGGSTYPATAR